MKTLHALLVFSLIFTTAQSFAQQKSDCTDIVYLQGGSVYRGTITERTPGGNLVIVTWSGVTMTVPEGNIKKIVQRCKEGNGEPKPYSFKEHGLYNATRFGILIGQEYFGENTKGFSIQHSTGWMFSRWLGAGIGAGIETYSPDLSGDATTYPVFAEMRGYFQGKNVTPFYALSGGWAFTGNNADPRNGYIENWRGGWMAKVQIGYRFGNNFTLHGGISLQKKTRDWRSTWGTEWGEDRILNKRFELGFGVLL